MKTQVKKPNALLAAINRAVPVEPPTTAEQPEAVPSQKSPLEPEVANVSRRPSRLGTKLVAGHFDPKVARQLRLIAAEEDTTVQALLEEALDLLFIKKGKAHLEDIVRG